MLNGYVDHVSAPHSDLNLIGRPRNRGFVPSVASCHADSTPELKSSVGERAEPDRGGKHRGGGKKREGSSTLVFFPKTRGVMNKNEKVKFVISVNKRLPENTNERETRRNAGCAEKTRIDLSTPTSVRAVNTGAREASRSPAERVHVIVSHVFWA